MFNTKRDNIIPQGCRDKTNYKSPEIIEALNKMFHGKCYICETKNLQSPRVEHRVPHRGDDNIKYDWNNLFLSCERCNSIKSDDFESTIDCCSEDFIISDNIFIKLEYCPHWKIIASEKQQDPSEELLETIKLINLCCNQDNTPTRKLSKQTLQNDINENYYLFMLHKMKIIKGNDHPDEINRSKKFIINMRNPSYPFSAVWDGMIQCDSILSDKLDEISETSDN